MRLSKAGLVIVVVGVIYFLAVLETWWRDTHTAFPAEAKPSLGSTVVNRLVGESIHIVQVESLENGWTSEIEVSLEPKGHVPFSHIHRSYTEEFKVLEGRLRLAIAGETRTVEAGQSFLVDRGVAHVPSNPFPESAVFRVRVSGVKNFTTCLSQIHRRLGDASSSWLMRHVRVGRLANVCDIYVSAIPWWIQSAGMTLSAPILRLLGFPVYEPMVNVQPEESNNE